MKIRQPTIADKNSTYDHCAEHRYTISMKSPSTTCAFCDSQQSSIFCNLGAALSGKLDAEKTVRRYEHGEVLFYEGAAPLAIYCLRDGLLKLTKSTPEGQMVVIRLLGAGDVAGFRAVVADEPYAATAEVVEPVNVCIIPAGTFRRLLQQSPEFKDVLIKKLANELRISEERMLDQAVLPARVRIARLLLFLLEQDRSGAKRTVIKTRLLRQDLAEAVGVTPQTFSRILHRLNQDGLISSSRSQIAVRDPRRLTSIASLK